MMARNASKNEGREKMIRRNFTVPEKLYEELEALAAEEFDHNNSLALRVAIRDLIKKSQRRKQQQKPEEISLAV